MSDAAGTDPQADFAEAIAPLSGRHLTLVVTGSLSAAFVPYWLNFVEGLPDGPEVRVVLTRTATTMVSAQTVSALLGKPVEVDSWGEHDGASPVHVELAEWTDVFVVHPCTFSYLGRLAAGLADTPVQLAFQCSPAPAVVCPALPPGTLESRVYQRHLSDLEKRGGVTVLPPTLGISAATGRREGLPPVHFPSALMAAAATLAESERLTDE